MTKTDAERIAVLETKIDTLETNLDAMAGQVREMHDLLLKAKGARLGLLMASMAAAGTGGALVSKFAAFLQIIK